MVEVSLKGTTVPHEVIGRFGAATVVLIPASAGTGIIAGASVRAVAELAGVRDILTKSLGSTNPVNLVKAAFDGFLQFRNVEDVEHVRGARVHRVPLRGQQQPGDAAGVGAGSGARMGGA